MKSLIQVIYMSSAVQVTYILFLRKIGSKKTVWLLFGGKLPRDAWMNTTAKQTSYCKMAPYKNCIVLFMKFLNLVIYRQWIP